MILHSYLSKDEPVQMQGREPTFVTTMLDTRHIETISTKRNRFHITCQRTVMQLAVSGVTRCDSHGTFIPWIWRLHPRRVPVLCVAIFVCLRTPWCDRGLNTWAAARRNDGPRDTNTSAESKTGKVYNILQQWHKCYEEYWHFKELQYYVVAIPISETANIFYTNM